MLLAMTDACGILLGYVDFESFLCDDWLNYFKTAEHLTLASLGKSPLEAPPSNSETGDRSQSVFTEDQSIPALFRAKLQDYFRSGYDRGHMCVLRRCLCMLALDLI